MDGTSTIIVLFFVFAMLSSLPKNPVEVTNEIAPGAPRSELFDVSQFDPAALPTAQFQIKPGQDLDQELQNFIKGYARAAHRGLAPTISSAIIKNCQDYDVNPYLACALIARESRFNPEAVSSSGAQGLGQLLPSTAQNLGVTDSFNIDQNVKGTVRYLKYLLAKWQGESQQVPLALASYLAGPMAISKTTGLSNQTKGYVSDIIQLAIKI